MSILFQHVFQSFQNFLCYLHFSLTILFLAFIGLEVLAALLQKSTDVFMNVKCTVIITVWNFEGTRQHNYCKLLVLFMLQNISLRVSAHLHSLKFSQQKP
jgi:hypothetical protein